MKRRTGYFFLIVSTLAVGSLWSPSAKRVLNPILIAWWPRSVPYDRIRHFEHIAAFATAGFTALSLWRTPKRAAWVLIILTATAISLEVGQHRIYRIPIEWSDIRDNLIGLTVGAISAFVFRRFSVRHSH